MTCEFCAFSGFISHQVREMMLGLREEFEYLECNSCGCLRIASVPDDLAKYYPSDSYYSYGVKKTLRTRLRRLHLRIALSNQWFGRTSGTPKRLKTLDWIQMFGLERNMRILDVGSGGALFVRDLRSAGFTGALGLDPFIARDFQDESGLAVKKAYLSEMGGGWDRIMFHHSLEHIADQIGTLATMRGKLSERGQCIVRIPLANWASQNYGKYWVQLDPPRHLCVHTEKSFRLAAAKAGLKVTQVVYDSDEFQFWASELYKKNIPLHTGLKERAKHFSSAQLRDFRRRADELNSQGLGDQAIFFLEQKD
jgi:Methyltransferase domain